MNTIKGSQQEIINWAVFVTPGIPVVVSSRHADVQETYFQAMASHSRARFPTLWCSRKSSRGK